MKRILISESSHKVPAQVTKIKESSGELKHVTVFFENCNFITKKYHLLSGGVHMILEFENIEVQIESANCGYAGGEPNAAVDVLTGLGMEKKIIEELIFYNDAVDLRIKDGHIGRIDTTVLFYPSIRKSGTDRSQYNKIECDKNVLIDLENRKVLIYNPQRTCWNGFLNLLSYMDNIKFEYYIGPNSPLEGGLYIGKGFDRELRWSYDRPDIEGTEHVNLCLYGNNFSVVCLIDREYEAEVIEAVYLALTGKRLVPKKKIQIQLSNKSRIKLLYETLNNKKLEKHETIMIERTQMGKNRR